MKKVMWLGLSIEITVLIIMLLFVVFKKPVPGVLVGIFVAGMLTSIISSFFVQREKIKDYRGKGIISELLLIPGIFTTSV